VVSKLKIMAGDGTSTRGRLAAEEQNRSIYERGVANHSYIFYTQN
jgi:hypothetical protein